MSYKELREKIIVMRKHKGTSYTIDKRNLFNVIEDIVKDLESKDAKIKELEENLKPKKRGRPKKSES